MPDEDVKRLVGSVMVMGFDGLTAGEHARTLIERHHVRNVILFSRNIKTREQTLTLTSQLQEWAIADGQELPLIICTDQENGIVRRLGRAFPGLPGNMAVGATGDPALARAIGEMTALQLRAVGINMNLGPVLDVNNNPDNPVIGVRSYGEDPQRVLAFGRQMIEGLQARGVIACAKHFPGHGDTAVDSHVALPIIAHDRLRLEAIEWVPFAGAVDASVDAIMTAHVIFAAFDRIRPATVSRSVLTGILRDALGFRGLVTTDSMEMKAIADTIGIGRACVQALAAGADMIMVSHQLHEQEEAIATVCQAIDSGELDITRVQDAAQRIATIKRLRLRESSMAVDEKALSQAEQLSRDVCERAVTIVRAARPTLPLDGATVQRVVILQDGSANVMMAADPGSEQERSTLLEAEVKHFVPQATTHSYVIRSGDQDDLGSAQNSLYPSADECLQADLIIVGLCGTRQPTFLEFVRHLCIAGAPVVILALRSPYDLRSVPEALTAIALYEDTPWMIRTAVRALFSTKAPQGRLPVRLV